MPVTRSAAYVKHCPRCYREIKSNSPIEVFHHDEATGRKKWAHVGCRRPSEVTLAAAQAQAARAQAVANDNDGDGDDDRAPTSNGAPVAQAVPAAPPAPPVVDVRMIANLVGEAISDAGIRLRREIGGEQKNAVGEALERLECLIADRLDAIEKQKPTPKYLVIQAPEQSVVCPQGELFHPKFDRIMRLARAGKNIFLPGPTGLGKTHLAEQVAKFIPNPDGTVGRPFGLISCTIGMPDSELLGRSIPNITTGENVFHASDFVRCYEEGGVFLLDEIDAGDANTLLRINAAIANGRLPVPSRTVNPYAVKHPNFVLLAAANTIGSGADRQYVGRNQLDEATLDRFRAYIVPMDYDPELEKRLCPHPRLYDLLAGLRAKIRANRLERIVSTRLFAEAYDSVVRQRCQSLAELLEAFFGGWTAEEQTLVLGKLFKPDDFKSL